ncbi:beta-galactosidase [Wenyingzhuangia heitensis]|uniref:Beta-galactosidase n=1 Tax=Wenyingzhuangia heitensis TaxID=1487859 RepID=A0ABX0UE76_9FLAO|nr:beta-galactosidase [Wenyingzhuangia heitensis]NIJ46165.1 beta-galactosidase [Wenyingzhuangia heitensis]
MPKIKKQLVFCFLFLYSALQAQTLEETAETKIAELNALITQAENAGIDALREKTTVRTAEIFLDYANWDEDNISMNTDLFTKVTAYKNNSSEMANLLPDFERNDVITMLEESITVLTKLINKEYTRTTAPNIDWTQVNHTDDQLTYNGKPAFIADYTWKPRIDLLTDYHGNQDGFFLTPSYVTDQNGTIRSNIVNELSDKNTGGVGFIFFNNKNVPAWSKTKYGSNFEMRTDTYTGYDIDHPGAREMMGFLIEGTVPYMADKKYAELGYMLCNEPHFFTQKTGDKLAWASGPVSNYTFDKFKTWLEAKHTNIARLNTLWNTSFASFNDVTIEIPIDTSNKGTAMWYDWALFNMYRVTEWYTFLKSEIRKYDTDAKVHLKIMPNLWSENQRIHGIDLEALTEISGIVGNDSGSDYKHMWKNDLEWQEHYGFDWRELCMAYDFMKSIAPEKINYNTELHYLSTGRSRDLYMKPSYARATFWMAHTLGLTASQTWFWARREDGSPRNGLDVGNGYAGSNNHQPRVTNEVALTMLDLNAHADLIMKMQRQRKPIRLFYSKTSAINKEEHMDEIFHLYEKLHFEGVPLGFVTKDVINKQDNSLWDVVLVHKNQFITPEEQTSLQTYLDNGGTIITDTESLTSNEYGESITTHLHTNNGGNLLYATSLENYKTLAFNVVSAKNLLPEVTITETNANGIKTCVWKCVKNSKGNNVVSIVNIGNKEATVDFSLKNVEGQTELYDLFKGISINKTQTLQPYDMLFVEITDSALTQNILPTDPYGFENTNVFWSSGGHDASVAGNIVEAWTQNVGFTQTSERAKEGTYSMKCDLVTTAGTNPKLQTWRTNTHKEHEFTTEVANYDVKMWVYLEGDTPSGARLTLDSQTAKPQVNFDLSSVAKNQWVQVEASNKLNSGEAIENNWFSFIMTGLNATPNAGSAIYFDEISIQKSDSLSVTTAVLEGIKIVSENKKIQITAPIKSNVLITNISGTVIYHQKTTQDFISTQNLQTGIYIVKVVHNGKSTLKKVMVL